MDIVQYIPIYVQSLQQQIHMAYICQLLPRIWEDSRWTSNGRIISGGFADQQVVEGRGHSISFGYVKRAIEHGHRNSEIVPFKMVLFILYVSLPEGHQGIHFA